MTQRGMIALSALFTLMFLGCTLAGSVHRRILREISAKTLTPQPGNTNSALTTTTTTSTGTPVKPLCSYIEPCGWAVYKKFTRVFEYYKENTCRCPSHKHCHRTGDDLSINAYVYTCIVEEINETIQWVHPPLVYTPEPNWHEDLKERLKQLAPTTTPAPQVTVNGNIYDK